MFSVPVMSDAVCLIRPRQCLADGVRSLRQRFRKHMGVDIFRCPGVAVAEMLGDHFRGYAHVYQQRSIRVPVQYNKDKSENPRKIKGFRDLSLFFFRLFFLKIRLCEVSRKGQCYINDKIISTGNGGMNGKQKTDCLQRNYRCL